MARLKSLPTLPVSADEVEQQFYEALQHGDIEKLMAVWADDDQIACVHPGGPRVTGSSAIRASFDMLFANGPIAAEPQRVRRLLSPGCTVHSVLEQVRLMTPEGPQVAWVVATNVYVNTAEGWRLVTHHASPGTSRELQDLPEAVSVLH